jgi:hypothetical protein
MTRTKITLLAVAAGLTVAMVAAAAQSGSGVRLAKNGKGAYIGDNYNATPKYIAAVLGKSSSVLEIAMHTWTTCYPSYETVNGVPQKLTPAQQKNFASNSGMNIPIPNVPLSPGGAFQKSETIPGKNGSHPTISGQVHGNKISGTFTATGIENAGNRCDNVSYKWTANFDSSAEPDPTSFELP